MGPITLAYLVVAAAIGAAVGATKGRPVAGAVFGLLIGPFGWLLIAIGPNEKPACPFCKGTIIEGAVKCKNCGSDLVATQSASEPPRLKLAPGIATRLCPHCTGEIPRDAVKCRHCKAEVLPPVAAAL